MSVIQKNIFGDNVIYSISPDFTRQLNDQLQGELLLVLGELEVNAVVIRIESGGETSQFANIIAEFLQKSNIMVANIISVTQSEIERNEFSIQKHPSDPNFAIIKIGPLM